MEILLNTTFSNSTEISTSSDLIINEFDQNNGSYFGNISELPLDMQFNDGHRMAIVMYLALMIAAATGNIYVFFSILRIRQKKRRLGRINLLLFNLAIADLLVTFIMMPLEIAWNATVSWLAGDLACRFLSFSRVFGLYLSGFVTVCICLDRYFVIINPLTIYDTERRNRRLLVGAWILSVVCSLPQSFIFHVETHPVFQWYQQCITFNSFPSSEYELAYNLFGFCVMYGLPMLTIVYCYLRIFWKLRSISRQNQNENELRRSNARFLRRAKTKTMKMAIITAAVFWICWTPYNIICLWYWFDKDSAAKLDQRIQKTLFVFACTNSCLNPLIYGWYHVGGRSRTNSRNTSSPPKRRDQIVVVGPSGIRSNVISPSYDHQESSSLITPEMSTRKCGFAQRPYGSVVTQNAMATARNDSEEKISRLLKGTYV